MTEFADSKLVAKRTMELLGGPEQFRKITGAEFGEMQRRWNQDVEVIGRILRSHLYVEHYMSEYIEKANPRLGSVAKARLTFSQKLELLDQKNPQLVEVLPGVKHLNAIRNRLAHRLSANVTTEDAAVFLNAKLFKALRNEGAKPATPSQDPLDILEEFAQYTSSTLSNEFSAFGNAFRTALNEFTAPAAT
jgi:hypothetical protein